MSEQLKQLQKVLTETNNNNNTEFKEGLSKLSTYIQGTDKTMLDTMVEHIQNNKTATTTRIRLLTEQNDKQNAKREQDLSKKIINVLNQISLLASKLAPDTHTLSEKKNNSIT